MCVEIEPIYSDALDFALANPDIENIAITGQYGAGKSSVWKSYATSKDIKKIIYVSLGTYWEKNGKCRNVDFYDKARLEKQLINIISSQVKGKGFVDGKYSYYSNHKYWPSIAIGLSIFSSLLLLDYDDIFKSVITLGVYGDAFIHILLIALIAFCITCLINFAIGKNYYLSGIGIGGTSASLNCSEESIIDKDIRDLIYILEKSNADYIVFEDLDRVDDPRIFIKLKEVNEILNNRMMLRDRPPVRFVYMLREDLFNTNINSKIFDCVIPTIPKLNAINSEEYLNIENNKYELGLSMEFIRDISYYLDDFRTLKNAINQYVIFKDTLDMEGLGLSNDKLFALIVVKVLIPNEYALLYKDEGLIPNALLNIIKEEKRQNSKYEFWKNSLLVDMPVNTGHYDLPYFVTDSINEGMSGYKGSEEYNSLFGEIIDNSSEKEASLLIMLLIKRYIDNTYRLYIGRFESSYLTSKDIRFINNIIERGSLMPDYELDNPGEVLNRLTEMQMHSPNILNISLLRELIYNRSSKELWSYLYHISNNGLLMYLIEILNDLYVSEGNIIVDNFVGKLLTPDKPYNNSYIQEILGYSKDTFRELHSALLVYTIFHGYPMSDEFNDDKINHFSSYYNDLIITKVDFTPYATRNNYNEINDVMAKRKKVLEQLI